MRYETGLLKCLEDLMFHRVLGSLLDYEALVILAQVAKPDCYLDPLMFAEIECFLGFLLLWLSTPCQYFLLVCQDE